MVNVKVYNNYDSFVSVLEDPSKNMLENCSNTFNRHGFIIKILHQHKNMWCNLTSFPNCSCTMKEDCDIAIKIFKREQREQKLKRILK